MSSCQKNPNKCCNRKNNRPTTLEAMIQDFIDWFRPGELKELAFFRNHPYETALEHAALAKDHRGKRFSHQRRLTRISLSEAKKLLFSKKNDLQNSESFEKVLKIVQTVTSQVHGLGELYAYDTALRIAAARQLSPSNVYLHAGTRVGARRLGIFVNRDYFPLSELPQSLRRLKAHEVESFLCIYKNQLGAVTQRRGQ